MGKRTSGTSTRTNCILLLLLLFNHLIFSSANDDGQEFVDQVLAEEAEHCAPAQRVDPTLAQEQRFQQQAQQREREFEQKLLKMRDEETRKAALRKKKRDAKVVHRVLKAQDEGNLYGVLGLPNNRYIRIPGRSVVVVPKYLAFELPEVIFFRLTEQKIKRAFREAAKKVHPDKNSDGRAVQAFWAVEEAAKVLLDAKQRASYDDAVRSCRQARRERVSRSTHDSFQKVYGVGKQGVGIIRTLLGPFAIPVSMLCVLIF